MAEERLSNIQFSNVNRDFIDACREAKVDSSRRQASKWRRKKGIAYKTMKEKKS